MHLTCFVQQKDLLVAGATTTINTNTWYSCTTSSVELLQQHNSSSISSRTHEARVSVTVRSACVGLTLEPFVHVLDIVVRVPGSALIF